MGRKFLLLVLIIAIAAVLGGPFVVGMQLESVHKQFVKRLLVPGSVEAKDSNYARGWLKSTARDSFLFKGGRCASEECEPLKLDTVVYHGPIAIGGIMEGAAPMTPVQAVMVSKLSLAGLVPGGTLEPALPQLVIRTTVDWSGRMASEVSLPSSTHSLKPGPGKLVIGGAKGQFEGHAGSPDISGELQIGSIRMDGENGRSARIDKAGIKIDGNNDGSGFVGRITESAAQVAASDSADAAPFELSKLSLAIDRKAGSRRVEGQFQAMKSDGRDYGPGRFETEAGKSEFTLRNLAIKTPDGDVTAGLHLAAATDDAVLPAWMRALSGDVSQQLLLLNGAPDESPKDWLQAANGNLSLQLPAVTLWNVLDARLQKQALAMAAQSGQPFMLPPQDAIGAEVSRMVNANMFVPKLDMNAYAMEAGLQEGQVTLNGQAIGDWNSAMGAMMGPTATPAP